MANKEQVVVCLKWVDESYEIYEYFVGLYVVECTKAQKKYYYAVITDVLLRFNPGVSKVPGQCYNGASAMSGEKSGFVAKLSAVEPRAACTLCFGHALNLACADTIRQSKVMQDALDTTYEITRLIKKSPHHDAILKCLKKQMASDSPGICILHPTRWTVKVEALKSILDNFNVLLEFWDESLEVVRDTEMKARV